MKRTKSQLMGEANAYFNELKEAFPVVELVEVLPERYAGADMWIALRVPSSLVDEVVNKTTELNSRWAEEKGLSILATVQGKSEPVVA